MYIIESLCHSLETNTTLEINYTSIKKNSPPPKIGRCSANKNRCIWYTRK